MTSDISFRWRHFEGQIILLCVRWYLPYYRSYRDLEEMMAERGLDLDHTTIYRWVQKYAPELEKRCKPYPKQTNDSWRQGAWCEPHHHSSSDQGGPKPSLSQGQR